ERLIRPAEPGRWRFPEAIEEARQRRQVRAKGPELLPAEVLLPPQDPPPVDLVQRLLLPPRPAAVEHSGVKRLHRLQRFGKLRRRPLQVHVEPQVALLPRRGTLLLQLLLEIDSHQGMGVEGARLTGIGRQQETVL